MSAATKPFVVYDVLSIDGKEVGGKLLYLPAIVAEKIRQLALTCISRKQCVSGMDVQVPMCAQ